MSILILNRMSNNSAQYYEWLKELDEPIVMLCDEVRKDRVDDRYDFLEYLSDWRINGNLEWRVMELHKKYKFRRIISFSETDLIRASMLRELLGIEGQNAESAKAFRNKITMKKILKEHNLNVPEFKAVNHPSDLVHFCNKFGFPVVYKPIDGAGSQDTEVIYSWSDVKRALTNTAFKQFEVEEFIEGDMYHIDGLWNNNKIEFLVASKYVNGCLAYQDNKYLGSYVLDDNTELHEKLLQYTTEVMEALPSPQVCPIHAEVFVTPEGRLCLCEIASRAGGARIIETINKLFHFNILKEATLSQCIEDYMPTEKKRVNTKSAGWALIPPKQGILKKMPDKVEREEVIEFLKNAKEGEVFKNAARSVDHVMSVIVSGHNAKEVEENLDKTVSWINSNTEWEKTNYEDIV